MNHNILLGARKLVVSSLIITASSALHAAGTSVTTNGYTIGVVNGSYTSLQAQLGTQAWWGSQALAQTLAGGVNSQLGNYDGSTYTGLGIFFAYGITPDPYTSACYWTGSADCLSTAVTSLNTAFNWAIVVAPSTSTVSSTTLASNTPALAAARVIDANTNLLNLFSNAAFTTDQQISNAVSQTLPLLTGGSTAAVRGTMSTVNNIILSRLDHVSGRASGDSFLGDKNFWLKPFASRADQNDRDGVAGYKAETYGLAAGFDGTLSSALRIGGAFAYTSSDISGKSAIAPQNNDANIYQLIGYGSYALDNRTDINFQADIGQNTNKGRRQIAFTSSVASSNYDSETAHMGLGIGRAYPLTSSTTLTPSLRADYTWIKDKSYQETGAGLLNLNVASRNTEAFVVGIDGKLAHQLNDQTTLVANLGVGYDTINKQDSITAAFAGASNASFVTYGIDPSPWIGRGGVGAVYKLKNGFEITARYDVEYRESFLNQTASANMRWSF